jgi:hypothetical protein
VDEIDPDRTQRVIELLQAALANRARDGGSEAATEFMNELADELEEAEIASALIASLRDLEVQHALVESAETAGGVVPADTLAPLSEAAAPSPVSPPSQLSPHSRVSATNGASGTLPALLPPCTAPDAVTIRVSAPGVAQRPIPARAFPPNANLLHVATYVRDEVGRAPSSLRINTRPPRVFPITTTHSTQGAEPSSVLLSDLGRRFALDAIFD